MKKLFFVLLLVAGCEAANPSSGAEPVFETIRDCDDCPELVPITMGEERLYVGIAEVSVGEYGACVEAGVCSTNKFSRLYVKTVPPNYPMGYISYVNATNLAKFYSEKTGKTYRLPTKEEYEFLTSDGQGNYVFDSSITACEKCDAMKDVLINYEEMGMVMVVSNGAARPARADEFYPGIFPSKTYGPTAMGLYELQGSKSEMTSTCKTSVDGDCKEIFVFSSSSVRSPRYLAAGPHFTRVAADHRDLEWMRQAYPNMPGVNLPNYDGQRAAYQSALGARLIRSE